MLPLFVRFLFSQCPPENAETKTKYIFLVYVSINLYNARTALSFLMHELFKHISQTLYSLNSPGMPPLKLDLILV